jgi:hypothetical protein
MSITDDPESQMAALEERYAGVMTPIVLDEDDFNDRVGALARSLGRFEEFRTSDEDLARGLARVILGCIGLHPGKPGPGSPRPGEPIMLYQDDYADRFGLLCDLVEHVHDPDLLAEGEPWDGGGLSSLEARMTSEGIFGVVGVSELEELSPGVRDMLRRLDEQE